MRALFFLLFFCNFVFGIENESESETFEISAAKDRILSKIRSADNPYHIEMCWANVWSEETLSYLHTNLHPEGGGAEYRVTSEWQIPKGHPLLQYDLKQSCKIVLIIKLVKIEAKPKVPDEFKASALISLGNLHVKQPT